MSRLILLVTFTAMLAMRGAADSLQWEYDHGWTKGFVVVIDDEKGTMTIHNRDDDTTKSAHIINAKNILLYIGALMQRMPEAGIGQAAIDGERSKLELRVKDIVTERIVYNVYPPGMVGTNKDYQAVEELEEVERFRTSLDGYLVRSLLFQLVEHYFPAEENRKSSGRESANSGKILTDLLSVMLCLALLVIAFLVMKTRGWKSG